MPTIAFGNTKSPTRVIAEKGAGMTLEYRR